VIRARPESTNGLGTAVSSVRQVRSIRANRATTHRVGAAFEGAGAISRWRIDLPNVTNAFEFETIPDIILELGCTAQR
jgi:hypothetical protein